jgi:hypothetical protein
MRRWSSRCTATKTIRQAGIQRVSTAQTGSRSAARQSQRQGDWDTASPDATGGASVSSPHRAEAKPASGREASGGLSAVFQRQGKECSPPVLCRPHHTNREEAFVCGVPRACSVGISASLNPGKNVSPRGPAQSQECCLGATSSVPVTESVIWPHRDVRAQTSLIRDVKVS